MKQCPVCKRVYSDETLNYCLDDGASLVYRPGRGEAATVSFPAGDAAKEAPTKRIPSWASSNAADLAEVDKASSTRDSSIAVLPFTNMSSDADNEYFCDGLSEEILNSLTKVDDL